jgi:hypothetical protein
MALPSRTALAFTAALIAAPSVAWATPISFGFVDASATFNGVTEQITGTFAIDSVPVGGSYLFYGAQLILNGPPPFAGAYMNGQELVPGNFIEATDPGVGSLSIIFGQSEFLHVHSRPGTVSDLSQRLRHYPRSGLDHRRLSDRLRRKADRGSAPSPSPPASGCWGWRSGCCARSDLSAGISSVAGSDKPVD